MPRTLSLCMLRIVTANWNKNNSKIFTTMM
jgi:hypothetical protein